MPSNGLLKFIRQCFDVFLRHDLSFPAFSGAPLPSNILGPLHGVTKGLLSFSALFFQDGQLVRTEILAEKNVVNLDLAAVSTTEKPTLDASGGNIPEALPSTDARAPAN